MSVNAGDVLRVTADMLGNGRQHIQNVYYVRNNSVVNIPDGDARDDVAEWLNDMYGSIVAFQTNLMSYNEIKYFNVTQDIPLGVSAWPTLTEGTSSPECLPVGVAALIGLNTGVLRVHGRKYIGQLTEADLDEGVWDATFLAALVQFGAFLLQEFVGGTSGLDWLPGVVDKVGAFWSFLEGRIAAEPAYQRRRRLGTGY